MDIFTAYRKRKDPQPEKGEKLTEQIQTARKLGYITEREAAALSLFLYRGQKRQIYSRAFGRERHNR